MRVKKIITDSIYKLKNLAIRHPCTAMTMILTIPYVVYIASTALYGYPLKGDIDDVNILLVAAFPPALAHGGAYVIDKKISFLITQD